jgi:alanine racemase
MDFDAPLDPEEARLRPTYAVVSRGRLRANLAAVAARAAPARVMAILKANAYGHGLEAVASCLAPRADAFGVALVEEGITLRRLGIENPILVMGGIWTRQIPLFLEHSLTFTAPSIARLRDIEDAAAAHGARAKVHLKIDTGMERIGVHHYSAEGLLEAAARSPHVEVEGIYTHFANADAEDLAHARLQLERFLEVLLFYERRSLPMPVRHVANSAALLRMPEARLDMVRPGILLYGVYPFPDAPRTVAVKPALSWRSRVVYFKVVEAGSAVSYGSTWQSDHRVRLVTVPVGYGDGYFRSLSNRAEVVLRGERRPVVGRVCMDQVMVNIEWGEAWNGDEVVLIGEQGGARVTVEELADWAGTIPYEILTAINARVPRLYEP